MYLKCFFIILHFLSKVKRTLVPYNLGIINNGAKAFLLSSVMFVVRCRGKRRANVVVLYSNPEQNTGTNLAVYVQETLNKNEMRLVSFVGINYKNCQNNCGDCAYIQFDEIIGLIIMVIKS